MLKNILISATRVATAAVTSSRFLLQNTVKPALIIPKNASTFNSFLSKNLPCSQLLHNSNVADVTTVSTRNITKFSMNKGKRVSDRDVLKRFYRLHWGIWIRTKCGRNKKLWKKRASRKRRLRQHVFCNATQSTMLDKMVTNYWRKPKYFVDDPYEPYHTREEWQFTYKKPKPYFPPEQQ
ncbi:hypothetical protein NQ315_010724 [Exocentrus adspersus]|uniref:Large ribosomal subunit protein bL35m n=1 Tax=Exocentrus adspersus TaxID=1586481 RepID=A0AAV8VUI5_9CUCU|nr:hypothetical protein NQ315_010724 [Exocentrus adspersus]